MKVPDLTSGFEAAVRRLGHHVRESGAPPILDTCVHSRSVNNTLLHQLQLRLPCVLRHSFHFLLQYYGSIKGHSQTGCGPSPKVYSSSQTRQRCRARSPNSTFNFQSYPGTGVFETGQLEETQSQGYRKNSSVSQSQSRSGRPARGRRRVRTARLLLLRQPGRV
jgi:hypothetical protein